MKKQLSTRAALVRYARIATASAAFALIAACGGGGDDNNNSLPPGGVKLQVVSFGDSLSDVGTYAPVAAANFGGGRFTTNPGQVGSGCRAILRRHAHARDDRWLSARRPRRNRGSATRRADRA